MTVSLSDLLADDRFHLRLRVVPDDRSVLDTAVSWVHSSDLVDPTPWLEAGQLLLTDGAHFQEERDSAFAAAYVERLRHRGVLGIGFATDILLSDVPAVLEAECRRQEMVLIEVADRTPFMAIIRRVADDAARERTEELERSLEAHRAVARAALRPDGLTAIVAELERRVGGWVELYDGSGGLSASSRRRVPPELQPLVADAVQAVLARGSGAAQRYASPDHDVMVQSVGGSGRPRGALVLGNPRPLDAWGKELVASVIALASIALEQNHVLQAARDGLRGGLLELLLAGEVDTARRTAAELGAPVPDAPLRVLLLPDARTQRTASALESVLGSLGGRLFAAPQGADVVLVVAESRAEAAVDALAADGVRVWVSERAEWADVRAALAQARHAGQHLPLAPVARFAEVMGSGMLGALRRGEGALVATALLEPLRSAPEELRVAVEAWFAHDCALDPTARGLGIHRHTLRTRIAAVGTLLGRDLDRFDDRAELWTALRLVDPLTTE